MRAECLTLDLGNSALKLVDWRAAPTLVSLAWTSDWEGSLRAAVAGAGGGRALISCVAAARDLDRVTAICAQGGLEVSTNPEVGLRTDCHEEHTIGRDRLYAALGVWQASGASAIVVDAGTALTVDALRGAADGGVFLGGAIAPGPELLARSLAAGTADLYEVQARADAPALGKRTLDALTAGVSVGFRGAAQELIRQVAREAQFSMEVPVWLTGGAAPLLDGIEVLTERPCQRDPLLVHRGLCATSLP